MNPTARNFRSLQWPEVWNDPALLSQEPFLSTFAAWKYELEGHTNTRSDGRLQTFMNSLTQEMKSAGIDKELRKWADLASNLYPEPESKVKVDHQLFSLFIRIQWELYNKRDAKGLLNQVIRSSVLHGLTPRGLPFSGGNAKRKTQVEQHKGVQKRRKQELTEFSSHPTDTPSQTQHSAMTSSRKRKNRSKEGKGIHTAQNEPEPIQGSGPLQIPIDEAQETFLMTSTSIQRATMATKTASHVKANVRRSDFPGPRPSARTLGSLDAYAPRFLVRPTAEHTSPSPVTAKAIKNEEIQPLMSESTPEIFHPEYPSNWLKDVPNDLETSGFQVDHSFHAEISRPEPSQPDAPPADDRPPLPGYPPIWAQSRQEVCESFDWFRSYQGGVYHVRNVARGYLLGAFAASRDAFKYDGKLIISHGGGKAQSVRSHRGQHTTQEADDQLAQDKSVRALLGNYRSRHPIALLIDDKYPRFPYKLDGKDVTYAVLGFYTIIHAWAEYQDADNERGRVVRYKFAFQWCESQGEPWWLKFNTSGPRNSPTDLSDSGGISQIEYTESSFSGFPHIEQISAECKSCHEPSAQVYEKAWVCLNPTCPRFWQHASGKALGDDLEYNSKFLQLAPADSLAIPVGNLAPGLPLTDSRGITTDYAQTRGWHCQKCGRLSSRYKWEHWECMNCKAILKVEGKIRQARDLLFLKAPVSFQVFFIASDSGIEQSGTKVFTLRPEDGSRGICRTYKLPNGCGFIHHITVGNPVWNNDADSIFQKYQEQAATGALPFRRWPLRAHKCRGALLTNYFSQNAGVPYQYVGGTENTLPFDKVPDAVVRARDLIQTRIKQALGQEETFNEVLSAAYMERQRMAFHTDDEVGLGPFVAGLSLGSPALMHFRPLARHAPEGTQRNIAISFVLRHGDVLAMDGAGVQYFYEHTVVPTNFRIAATARYINATHPKRERSSS